ncbi:MAG: PEP-utilizing enzyme [Actinobacteria bacterium]|nr:PEP-utilizing enzyme [Actinomycetota bacterium]
MVTGPAYVIPQTEIDERVAARVGGKALALARMARAGIVVPSFVAVTTDVYAAYLEATGLGVRILFELERKDFAEMRWEELWDAALRIRSLFLTTPLPPDLRAALAQPIAARFAGVATVVRSSAPGEDSAGASFAGLHESYVNVRGVDAILEHVKLVWASLWSDAALLYRRELGLDPTRSVMAVVVQEIVAGERSGVAFSCHPENDTQALLEAVHGLNQGLVDGVVEPDRWTLDRRDGALLEHHQAERLEMMSAAADGVRLMPLPGDRRGAAPLAADEVPRVFGLAQRAERHFEAPQDVEWTLRRNELFALQSRPITTLAGKAGDGRAAYLSLTRSYDSLQRLRRRIEDEDIPSLVAAADRLAATPLEGLDDAGLRAALQDRKAAHDRGVDVYIADFIPFAHGARLFGSAYNDVVRPEDPYEFTDLLTATPMLSLRRNAALEQLAACLRDGDEAAAARALTEYLTEFGDAAGLGGQGGASPGAPMLSAGAGTATGTATGAATGTDRDAVHDPAREEVLAVARRLARRPAGLTPARPDPAERARRFIEAHPEGEQARAAELLDLGRASWRLRDDDNLYLGRLERLLTAALNEAARRGLQVDDDLRPREVTLPSPHGAPPPVAGEAGQATPAGPSAPPSGVRRQARQIVGQPAGPGLAVGLARVVADREDLAAFEDGEILVCDAIAPEMTFVVPLAAGIVERRGGMLIHGAIIAREYGLPCVTGVPLATDLIHTGDRLTVDGYLGIVVVG